MSSEKSFQASNLCVPGDPGLLTKCREGLHGLRGHGGIPPYSSIYLTCPWGPGFLTPRERQGLNGKRLGPTSQRAAVRLEVMVTGAGVSTSCLLGTSLGTLWDPSKAG